MDFTNQIETYTLPSKGKVYPEGAVVPEVTIRSMTTDEEMKRLSPSTLPYKHMCQIIDDCITSEQHLSSYDMCLGDYLFLLQKLRIVTYGSNYQMSTVCPLCGNRMVSSINLDSLKVIEFDKEYYDKYSTFTLPVTGKTIKLRLQTPRILDNITSRAREMNENANNTEGYDFTLLVTLEEIIETVDGRIPDYIMFSDWLRKLPSKDTTTILQYAEMLNNCVGLDMKTYVTCDKCTLEFPTMFKATAEFFRPALVI